MRPVPQAGVGVGGRDYWALREAAEDTAAPTLGRALLRPGAPLLRRPDERFDMSAESFDARRPGFLLGARDGGALPRAPPLRTADLEAAPLRTADLEAAPSAGAAAAPSLVSRTSTSDACALPLFVSATAKRRPPGAGIDPRRAEA